MTRRRPRWSAHTPPARAKSANGIPPAAMTRPRSVAEPRPSTAKAIATGVMRSPTTESACPAKSRRKAAWSRKDAGSLCWTAPGRIGGGA